MDFSNYTFRCSSLGKLMCEPKNKKATLSETTKTYLHEIYIEEIYDRKRDTSSKFTEKGIFVEEDALELMQNYFNKFLVKNDNRFENDFIKGTPDVIMDECIADAKSSWDIWTFFGADGRNKDYWWQMQGYMELVDRPKAYLCYCLVNTPEYMIVREKNRQMYDQGLEDNTPEFFEMEERVDKNMTFNDISEEKRIHAFEFERDSEAINRLYIRIDQCREYLNSLTF